MIESLISGMPHVHGVAWFNFTQEEEEKYLLPDKTFNLDSPALPALIDKWTQCKLKTGNDVLDKIIPEVQMHKHKDTCEKKGTICRFDFPKLPSPYTLVSKPPSSNLTDEERAEKLKKAKDIRERVKARLDEAIREGWDIFDLLDEVDISIKSYVEDCLEVSERGAQVVLARDPSEAYVNNYNEIYLYAWRANIDVQICTDAYAVVSYISDYLSKGEKELTRQMRIAMSETKGLPNDERMKHAKTMYVTHREICSSEAVYRLSRGLNLRQSNLKAVFVDSGFPQNRSTILRKVNEQNDLSANNIDDSDESEQEGDERFFEANSNTVEIMGRPGKFKRGASIHEKYALRPRDLEDVCLAQFATSYQAPFSIPKKVEWNGDVSNADSSIKNFASEKYLPKFIRLGNGRLMTARSTPAVIKLHSSKKKEAHESAYAELVLFSPWRNELELYPANAADCYKEFEKRYELIQANRQAMLPFSSTLEQIKEAISILEEERSTNYDDLLDSTFQQEHDDDLENLEEADMTPLPPDAEDIYPVSADCPFRPIKQVNDEQMIADVRSLSIEQKLVFEKLLSFCKSVQFSQSRFSVDVLPPRLIVHGKL